MSRLLFILVAISFLNRCIDLDHLNTYNLSSVYSDFDDIDNVAEYLLEEMTDDSTLISEEDEDNGEDKSSNVSLQQLTQQLYCESLSNLCFYPHAPIQILKLAELTPFISKGFHCIVIPPPDQNC